MGRKIELEITGDTSSLERALSGSQKKTHSWSKSLETASKGALIALGAIGLGVAKSVQAASNLEEQINKTGVVFRSSGDEIIKWSETTASSIGISQQAALEATGTFGNMLVPMGIARSKAADMSQQMVVLAADMASFNNASPEETLEALRAGLAGETEPLRRFGVFLNEARIKQEALRLGLVKGNEELTAAAKAQATYSIIMKDTADTQGDFQRTSDSLANQQRILKAQFEDTAAALGTALLPVATQAAGVLLGMVTAVRENATLFQVFGAAATVAATGIIALNTAVKIYNSTALLAIGVTSKLRLALASLPFVALATGIAILVNHLRNQAGESDAAADSQNRLSEAVDRYHQIIQEGQDARNQLRDANLRLEAAEIAVKRAVQNRRRVDKDANSTLLDRREADLQVAQADQELRRATDEVRRSGQRLQNQQGNLRLEAGKVQNEFTNLSQIYTGRFRAASRVSTSASGETARGLQNVRSDAGRAQGVVGQYANRLRQAAGAASASNPQLAATARVAATLAEAWGRVVSLPSAKSFVARFSVITTVETHKQVFTQKRQHGGPVQAGVPYIVGEVRPEVFVPSQGGRIVPRVPTSGGGAASSYPGGPVMVMTNERVARWLQEVDRGYRRGNGGRGVLG